MRRGLILLCYAEIELPDLLPANEQREKSWAALTSLMAAVGLTAFKIVVGVATGSLGILAEAAHSGLDLVAALLLSSRSGFQRPPDHTHLYGHGKIESLSALAETFLLTATCGWIVWEAAHRLGRATPGVEVTAGLPGNGDFHCDRFLALRVLARTAKKYQQPGTGG